MVVSIKSKQQAIADMPQSSELSTVHQRASLYLQLGWLKLAWLAGNWKEGLERRRLLIGLLWVR